MQDEGRRNKGDTSDAQCSTSVGQVTRDTETHVEQKPNIEIDLREGRNLSRCHLKRQRTDEGNQQNDGVEKAVHLQNPFVMT